MCFEFSKSNLDGNVPSQIGIWEGGVLESLLQIGIWEGGVLESLLQIGIREGGVLEPLLQIGIREGGLLIYLTKSEFGKEYMCKSPYLKFNYENF